VPVAFPAALVARARRATDAHGPDPALWFLNNVARNSPALISDFEIASLELQRLWAMSKNDRVKLCATLGDPRKGGYTYSAAAPARGERDRGGPRPLRWEP